MKLLIYVPARSALANGSSESGLIDYEISPGLAWDIADLSLDAVAGKFTIGGNIAPPEGVHRLQCACAEDPAVLDALATLKHQINMARSWARAALLDRRGLDGTDSYVPVYVERLWEKHPLALYRSLLGEEVAQAMRQVADVSPLV